MAEFVREVMTPEPVALQAGTPIQEAARMMRDLGIGDVVVLDGQRPTGLATDRDIVVRAVADGYDAASTTIDEVCSHDLVFVGPDDTIDRAVELMRIRAVRRIPVVNDGSVIGVISIGDIAIDRDQQSALAEISAAPANM